MDAEKYYWRRTVKQMQLKHNTANKNVSRANFTRSTNDDVVAMFREGNARKVTNCRIRSKLYQVITIIK